MIEPARLAACLEAMAGAPVLVVGDVMLDRFVYGEVARVSAEAPIPVLAHARETAMLGAAGNVARNIAALGGRARLVGLVGEDGPAEEMAELIAAEPDCDGWLVADAARPTTVKSRFVSAGQQLLRLDVESTVPAAGDAEGRLADAIAEAGQGVRAVLISDYGKGAVTAATLDVSRQAAAAAGAPVIVDSKAAAFDHYGAVDLIKPNAAELERATGLATATDAEVEAALARALSLTACRAILVTRAAKGMSLAIRGRPIRHFRRPPPEVFDTAGAGDTALAAMGLAIAAGIALEEAAEIALIASSVAVQKSGVAVVTPAEIVEAERVARRAPLDAKIVSPAEASARAASWRAAGARVGFTNGCFDILHPGHIAYLEEARGWCDRLIVAVNSDASVRRLKGPERPVNALEERSLVLAGLSAVDLVTAFEEETPRALIEQIRPDVLIKGGDYRIDDIVGAEFVSANGGEVRLAAFVAGHSTTATLARLDGRT